MGVTVRGEDIQRILAQANELAKDAGDELAAEFPGWVEVIRFLREERVPLTYTAVTAVVLAARAIYPKRILDVRDMKASTSPVGYSASAIAVKVAAFAKNQRIDLRSVSQNPINGQPFTHRERIERDMRENPRATAVWHRTYDQVIVPVNDMDSETALKVLALFMHLSRKVETEGVKVAVRVGGKATLDRVVGAVSNFVDSHRDNGKVGQAFVAAILDLLYGPAAVDLGHTHDPSLGKPGDVRVDDAHGTWLYSEAKQQTITQGAVHGFVDQVHDAGGERVAYFALINSGYPDYVRRDHALAHADRKGIGLKILESPAEAMDWLLPVVPGSYATVAEHLLERLAARLGEAHCPTATLSEFESLTRTFADVV